MVTAVFEPDINFFSRPNSQNRTSRALERGQRAKHPINSDRIMSPEIHQFSNEESANKTGPA
jgi:hypothetical protein